MSHNFNKLSIYVTPSIMERNTRKDIEQFLECRTIVVAGASRKAKSFSASVILHLESIGYNILSVNPNFSENSLERNEYKSMTDLPEGVNNLLVLTSPLQTASVMKQAMEKGIGNIWIQQKSDTPEALEIGKQAGINLISNQCIFMFTQPDGIHKFHYGMKKLFRTIPV